MLDTSMKEIEWLRSTLECYIKENEQEVQQRKVAFSESEQRNQKIINNSKISPVERLRAMVVNVLDSDEILQLHRLGQSLMLTRFIVDSVRTFQSEVAIELDLLNSKSILQASRAEEPKKYADIENDLQNMKRTINEEWKPLMESLKDIIDKRNKFLNENR